jgi:amidase
MKIEASQTSSPAPHPELEEITIAELQAKMESGELTARTLVEQYLDRIGAIDPKLHSVIELNPDAFTSAAQRDEERRRGEVRGPLHGVPVQIKDNIDTCDAMHTTAGSLALLEAPPPERDAWIVNRLREAGAVITGKTNLSEWANFRSTHSTSGWSARGGQTHNPYVLDRNPCGSSSGTGAAISAGLASVGVGTETNGSIICPSLVCGLVGIKPTLGLVSRSGIIPIAHSQDTAGPMARTVADAAILLGVLSGSDPADVLTSPFQGHNDYRQFLDADGARGARIGVARQWMGEGAPESALFESHLQVLKESGATLVEVSFPTVEGFDDDEHTVLLFEFKAALNAYLAARNCAYRTLADLIEFNEANRDREMPLFEQELFHQAQEKGDLNSSEYLGALSRLKLATQAQGIDAILAKDHLDAVVAPTGGQAWGLAAIAGYPSITVPAGFCDGLPIGVIFFGGSFSEPTLIKLAYAFEQKTRARQTPQFLPTGV